MEIYIVKNSMNNKEFCKWMKFMGLKLRDAPDAIGRSLSAVKNYRRGKDHRGKKVSIPEPIVKLCNLMATTKIKEGHDNDKKENN
jgi:hypothetical protein